MWRTASISVISAISVGVLVVLSGLASANLLEDADRIASAPEHSCDGVLDMLVDWEQLREDLSAVMEEVLEGTNAVLKYWQHIRPQTHTLDNIASFTESSETFASCRVGYFSVKAFMTLWSPQREEAKRLRLREDWDWFLSLSPTSLAALHESRWAYVLFSCWLLLASPEAEEELFPLRSGAPPPAPGQRPQELAAAFMDRGLLAEAQDVLRRLDRSEGLGLPRALTGAGGAALARALLAPSAQRRALELRPAEGQRRACRFRVCPLREEATPLDADCSCHRLFAPPQASQLRPQRVCIFMVDSRPLEPLGNITEVLAARYWSLAYEANRLYAQHHGYSISYVVPQEPQHYPSRKIGWAKVKVILDEMEARLPRSPQGCDLAVSIDTDAYFRGTERVEAVVATYMQGKEILFSQEYHTEERGIGKTHINGGFFIVRNSAAGRALLRDWYNVPELEGYGTYKKENPQGLNYCWDAAMHPLHGRVTALAPYEYFSCPRGQFIRHNWFKDLSFEAELQEAILQRWAEASPTTAGCVLCGEFHLIDLVRHASGKGWINNR